MISADFVPQLNSYAYSFGPPSEHHAQNYPGSPAKTIWVDNGFGGYTEVSDAGGRSEDMENLLNLLVEIRSSLGSNFLIALSVGRQAVWPASVATLDPYVDVFCVHAYGTAHFFNGSVVVNAHFSVSPSVCLSVCLGQGYVNLNTITYSIIYHAVPLTPLSRTTKTRMHCARTHPNRRKTTTSVCSSSNSEHLLRVEESRGHTRVTVAQACVCQVHQELSRRK